MKFSRKSLSTVFSAASLIPACLMGQTPADTFTVPTQVKAVLARPLQQHKVTDCVNASPGLTWRGATALNYSSEGLMFTGINAAGRSWKAIVPASGVLTCEVWSAQLAGQQNEALIVINYGHSADGYDAELTILMFDRQGRPVPWQAIGHFQTSPAGIAQITSAGPAHNAAIVVSTRTGDRREGYAFVSDLYEANSRGLHKVVGNRSGDTWPRLSGNANMLPTTRQKDSKSVDLRSTDGDAAGTSIIDAISPNQKGDVPVTLDNGSLLTARVTIPDGSNDQSESKLLLSDQTSIPVPRIIVADAANGSRTIFFGQNVPDAVSELRQGKYKIRVTGQHCDAEDCHPFILWARK
jgi:hypothetical protein